MRTEADKTNKIMENGNLIWVGRMDEVHGDTLIAFGHSEKEVQTLLFKKYKEVAKYRNEYEKLNGSSLVPRHGQRTKADFLDYFGGWIQPMEVGKAYIGDEDESRLLAKKQKV
tara:strand:- start:857 stop:1195 length:339 start_codon:yes stop_codon:yes gene_type:complete